MSQATRSGFIDTQWLSIPATASAPTVRGCDTIPFERRGAIRLPTSGQVLATFRDQQGRMGLLPMDLLDVSASGIGVRSPRPLDAGTSITLCEQADSHRSGSRAWGRAVVARQTSEGEHSWRLGLRLEPLLAA